MSNHSICFYEDLTKIIFQLSSNMHLIFLLMYIMYVVWIAPKIDFTLSTLHVDGPIFLNEIVTNLAGGSCQL